MAKIRNQNFGDQLQARFEIAGWEIVAKTREMEWWSAECWTLMSTRQEYGMRIFVYFLVDPQYEGVNPAEGVWEIVSSHQTLENWHQNTSEIARCTLKHRFIDPFVETNNQYRNSIHSQNVETKATGSA